MSEGKDELALEPLGEEVTPPEEEVVDAEVVEEEEELWVPTVHRTKKFSPNDAEIHLGTAKRMGHIFSYKRVSGKPVKFLIETVPTRYDHYHDPEARGQIVLTTREVMAFIEGIYAATRLRPERDERDLLTDRLVEGERWHPTSRAGDFYR